MGDEQPRDDKGQFASTEGVGGLKDWADKKVGTRGTGKMGERAITHKEFGTKLKGAITKSMKLIDAAESPGDVDRAKVKAFEALDKAGEWIRWVDHGGDVKGSSDALWEKHSEARRQIRESAESRSALLQRRVTTPERRDVAADQYRKELALMNGRR